MRASLIAVIACIGLPFTSLATDASAVALTPAQSAAIDKFIATQEIRRDRKHPSLNLLEYRDARSYVVGAIGSPAIPVVVVQYTLEGGNRWELYIAVFERATMQHRAHTRVGAKGQRSATLTRAVPAGGIELDTLYYGDGDALCCPSVPGSTSYELDGTSLQESEVRIDCSARKEAPK